MPYRDHAAIIKRLQAVVDASDRWRLVAHELMQSMREPPVPLPLATSAVSDCTKLMRSIGMPSASAEACVDAVAALAIWGVLATAPRLESDGYGRPEIRDRNRHAENLPTRLV